MSGIVEYKCPACGGAMEFDSTLQKMNCPYCDTTMTVEEFEAMQKKDEDNTGSRVKMHSGHREEIISGRMERQITWQSMYVSLVVVR